MFITRTLSALALATALVPGAARAARDYDNCTGFIDSLPATITAQGTWCLRKDLATAQATGAAITLAANNITIDCNDFKIGGLAGGPASQASGIAAVGRSNATVRRCNLRGFHKGLDLTGAEAGGGHRIEDNRLEGNLRYGLNVEGDGSLVRRNLVRDTGGQGNAVGLRVVGNVDVRDNTISGVTPLSDPSGKATATGIETYLNNSGTVRGNRVRGLVPLGGALGWGIDNLMGGRILVQDNQVVAGSVQVAYGIRCAGALGRMRGNIVNGFAMGEHGCSSAGGNDIHP